MKRLYNYIRKSLSLKLSLGVLILAMLIFSISLGLLYGNSRNMVRKQSIDRAETELKVVISRIENLLGTIETAANSNAWLINDRFHPDSLLDLTRRVVILNGNVDGCSFTAEPNSFPQYGRYFSAYTIREGDSIITVREAPYEYFDKLWYKTPRHLGEPCWVDPFDDYNEGTLSAKEIIASYCKPIYDDDHHFMGVMTTDLSLSHLAQVVQAEAPYPDSYFVLVGSDGRFYLHPDSVEIGRSVFNDTIVKQDAELIALGHEMTTGASGSRFVTFKDQVYNVSYHPIPGTSWTLALVCPKRVLLNRYVNLTHILIPLIGLGLLLILLFCRSIVSKAIEPVSKLVIRAQRLAEGHYDEKIPYTSRLDVVGKLQNSFSQMQDSIDRHVSEIRQTTADISRRNTELVKARQLAEESARQKVEFIQDVTHQIRTPLNIIMGFSQVIHDNFGELSAEEVHSIAEMMLKNMMTLQCMINMLYDSSDSAHAIDLSSIAYDEVSVNQVIRESIDYTLHQFTEVSNITFDTSLPDSFTIHSSQLYLMRTMRELLFNAAKYSDGQHILVKASSNSECVHLVVEDTGPGIPEAYREKMFEPFSKFNPFSEGLGLGLPLIRYTIASLGGILTYDADYQAGCRISIEMPVK